MQSQQAHTVKSYDDELKQLRDMLVQMGGIAEAQLETAVQSVERRDAELADRTVRADARVDNFEQEINVKVLRLLALRQPMAADLREIVAALKIASDIERIGDYAANIAKRSQALVHSMPVRTAYAIPRMAQLVQEMMKDVLDTYVDLDTERALDAWRRDEQVDALYNSLFRELLTYMMEDARTITPCTHLLFIAKNIERIGDHVTNIAETLHFQIRGEPMEGARPKGDSTSYAVIDQSAGGQE